MDEGKPERERDGTTVAHGGTAYCIPEACALQRGERLVAMVGIASGRRKEGRKVGGRVALDGRGGRARQSNSRAAACRAQANVRPSGRVNGGAVAVRASSLLKRAIWNEAGGRTDAADGRGARSANRKAASKMAGKRARPPPAPCSIPLLWESSRMPEQPHCALCGSVNATLCVERRVGCPSVRLFGPL